jgi:hypothetical protein
VSRLSKAGLEAIEAAKAGGQIGVSAISVWEAGSGNQEYSYLEVLQIDSENAIECSLEAWHPL